MGGNRVKRRKRWKRVKSGFCSKVKVFIWSGRRKCKLTQGKRSERRRQGRQQESGGRMGGGVREEGVGREGGEDEIR